MDNALFTAQERISGAMEALSNASMATGREADDELAILGAQVLLHRAMDSLRVRFGGAASGFAKRRLLMETIMLDGESGVKHSS